MKRFMKVLGVTGFAVFALCAVAVASSSAAQFTSTAAGTLSGKATSTQVFTAGNGTVECKTAKTTGTTVLAAESQAVTVTYGECKAFSLVGVTISPAHYILHASGTVDITEPISIEVEGALGCNITVAKKSGLSSVSYANNSGIEEISNVGGIEYTIKNHALGLCGSSGTNGTYVGNNLVTQAGATLTFDS